MNSKLIESQELIFCLTSYEDLDMILEIENDEENSKYVYSWSRDRHMQAIDEQDELHITIKTKDNEIIGYILLSGINNPDSSIEFRRIAINQKGKGYGHQSIGMIKKLAFRKYHCHRLWLDVFEDNIRAIRLYESEGFVNEGLLRECKKADDTYRSMFVMSMLDREYEDDGSYVISK